MKPLAAGLVFVFAVFHGTATVPWLTQPRDPAASNEKLILRVPRWARISWLSASLVAAAGAVVLAIDGWVGFVMAAVGMGCVCAMALANGFWMKGRPTISHHAVRVAVAIAILGLAALSLGG